VLRGDHIDVAGCRGVLALGPHRIPFEGLDQILPWPVEA
jgi:hypothetical protein